MASTSANYYTSHPVSVGHFNLIVKDSTHDKVTGAMGELLSEVVAKFDNVFLFSNDDVVLEQTICETAENADAVFHALPETMIDIAVEGLIGLTKRKKRIMRAQSLLLFASNVDVQLVEDFLLNYGGYLDDCNISCIISTASAASCVRLAQIRNQHAQIHNRY